MASLYAQYITERTDDLILEIEEGFATYRYLDEDRVYIVDIFVIKGARKHGIATQLADTICDEAKKRGCSKLIGTVNPLTYGSTESLKVLLAYGMELESSSDNLIVLKKGL